MAKRSSKKDFQDDTWFNTKWRPAMAWTYMAICILDFAVFPILWSLLQAYKSGQVTSQWMPITLQGAGLFHMSMGAILGITAWTRGQEKQIYANQSLMQATQLSTPQITPVPQPAQQTAQPFNPLNSTVTPAQPVHAPVIGAAPDESPLR